MRKTGDSTLERTGESIKTCVERSGCTMEQLVEQLKLSERTIRAYESGEYYMSVSSAVKLARLCDTTVTRLLGIKSSKTAGDLNKIDSKIFKYKYIRKMMNMNQTEFAEEIGVSRSTVSRYECGRGEMSVGAFVKLCSLCGLSEKEINAFACNIADKLA